MEALKAAGVTKDMINGLATQKPSILTEEVISRAEDSVKQALAQAQADQEVKQQLAAMQSARNPSTVTRDNGVVNANDVNPAGG